MALPSSGQISLGNNTGDTTTISVNRELGKASPWQQNISLNDAAVRSLFGVSSGAISMSDGLGKSNVTVSLAGLASVYGTAYPGSTAYAELVFYTNGSIGYGSSSGSGSAGTWVNKTDVGASYWIRFTQTSSYSSSTETGSARGSWLQLSSNRLFGVSRTLNGAGGRYYTVQIASDSGGSNIVATATGVGLEVEIIV